MATTLDAIENLQRQAVEAAVRASIGDLVADICALAGSMDLAACSTAKFARALIALRTDGQGGRIPRAGPVRRRASAVKAVIVRRTRRRPFPGDPERAP